MMNLEQRLGAIIGDLVIKNASLTVDLEAAQARIAELEKNQKPAKDKIK